MLRVLVVCLFVSDSMSLPHNFVTEHFKVGIEYEHSMPISGAKDRYRHVNNYDPFFVTVTATAKSGYVVTFLEVTATIDAPGEVNFSVIRGETGSKSITFQLVSNHTDFLSYSYLLYGITQEEYKKVKAAALGL